MRRLARSISDRSHHLLSLAKGKSHRYKRIVQVGGLFRPMECGIPLIRLGGDNDGGYLVPDDLDGIAHCFSPGVDDRARFEMDCLERGITSFLADGTVAGPPPYLRECSFTGKNLGAQAGPSTITLSDWIDKTLGLDSTEDLILQMDIEGAEFDVIAGTSAEVLSKFRIAVIEFHGAQQLERRSVFFKWRECLERLLEIFHVVHVHPNNCCGTVDIAGFFLPRVFEVTFLRKDRASPRGPVTSLPHPLDQANIPGHPELPLPKEWLT